MFLAQTVMVTMKSTKIGIRSSLNKSNTMYLYLNSVNISRANKLINKALRILYFFLTMKGWYMDDCSVYDI